MSEADEIWSPQMREALDQAIREQRQKDNEQFYKSTDFLGMLTPGDAAAIANRKLQQEYSAWRKANGRHSPSDPSST